MSLECWYYVAGIVSAGAAIAGLIGLWYYAKETHRLRVAADTQLSVAQDQLENGMKPCVLLMAGSVPALATTDFEKEPLFLKNVGSGPALNIKWQFVKNDGGPWNEEPVLPAGSEIKSRLTLRLLFDHGALRCHFESLSGIKYETTSAIGELTTKFDPRHTFKRI
jgi:hypothetical protein